MHIIYTVFLNIHEVFGRSLQLTQTNSKATKGGAKISKDYAKIGDGFEHFSLITGSLQIFQQSTR